MIAPFGAAPAPFGDAAVTGTAELLAAFSLTGALTLDGVLLAEGGELTIFAGAAGVSLLFDADTLPSGAFSRVLEAERVW